MILMDQADTGDTMGAAGPCWYLLVPPVLTSLLATTSLGDSLHGQGPALDTVVEGDTFFFGGSEVQHNLSGNENCVFVD